MTISKERFLEFLTKLEQNLIEGILDINDTLIDLISYAIINCNTKIQFKIICGMINIVKNKNLDIFNKRLEKLVYLTVQNDNIFKNLKSITSSKSDMDSVMYMKLIEKYIQKNLDRLVEITPDLKETFEYYINIIDTFDINNNETLYEYKKTILEYIKTIQIQELKEQDILNEFLL